MDKITKFFKHLFIPGTSNNYRAKALHHDFLTYYLVFAFSLMFLFKAVNYNFHDVLGFATDITVSKLYELTNVERQNNHLNKLNYNQKLSAAAYKKAQDMFAKNYWSHYGPDGTTPWNFILESGYQYQYAGENLAKNFLFSQGVIEAWLNSKTHRENLLKQDYTDVGYAVVNGLLNGEETTLVVQLFGKPTQTEINTETNNKIAPEVPNMGKSESVVTAENKNSLSLSRFTFNSTTVFIIFLIIVLIADFYIATRMGIVRIHNNIPHFVFLTFILLGLIFFFTKGAII